MNTPLIGESPLFLALLDKVSRLAPIDRPVLIMGERGTGKELIAQRLHYLSKRWDQPLVTLNCATLSEGLIDSELFGHESGSFTGAKSKHVGRFERAENGTLFLDELGNAPLSVQEKLLRVIEYGQYERIGGNTVLNANVRIIAATNADLLSMANQERFRHDLLDRLAFDVVHLPPLRERIDDIMPLATHFAIKMCHELGLSHFAGFTSATETQLRESPWPGNIRELKNAVERTVYQHLERNNPISSLHIDPFIPQWQRSIKQEPTPNANALVACSDSVNPFPIDFKLHCQNNEKRIIEQALTEAKFHQQYAAELLGLTYHQLRGLIRKYAISNKFDSD
jgi:psp operon transcriptional activator